MNPHVKREVLGSEANSLVTVQRLLGSDNQNTRVLVEAEVTSPLTEV